MRRDADSRRWALTPNGGHVKTNRGVVLIILGVVGFYVVNGAQGMLATMGALQLHG
jgi:hypothetical protein